MANKLECRNIFLIYDENNMIIKLCGYDYTVAAICVNMVWMMLCQYTGGSVHRKVIVIICYK
jgi:hypothetical protein